MLRTSAIRANTLTLVVFVSIFSLSGPRARASAAPFALANIGLGISCAQQNGGSGAVSASASISSCIAGSESASGAASVSMLTGNASVDANSTFLAPTTAFAEAFWSVGGTITGSGTITLQDTGITWSTGGNGLGFVDLIISDPNLGTLASVCDFTQPGQGNGCISSHNASVTANVTNGEQIFFTFSMVCQYTGPGTCTMNDPLSLILSPGLQFNSGVPGFLSGSASSTPEPSSLLLLGTGLLGLGPLVRRFAKS